MFAVGVTASVTSFPNRVVPFPKTQEIHHRTAPFVMVRAFSWWISCVFVRGDGCLPGASEADAGPATNVHGSYETASVVLSHLASGTVALATISTVAGILTRAAITASIALLARRMLQGRAFWRLLSRTVTIAGRCRRSADCSPRAWGLLSAWAAVDQLNGAQHTGFWLIVSTTDGTSRGIGALLMPVDLAFEHRAAARLHREARLVGDADSGTRCRLDELLEERGMTLTRLAELVGVSIVNLSVLKNDRARHPVFDAARDLRRTRVRGRRAARARAALRGAKKRFGPTWNNTLAPLTADG